MLRAAVRRFPGSAAALKVQARLASTVPDPSPDVIEAIGKEIQMTRKRVDRNDKSFGSLWSFITPMSAGLWLAIYANNNSYEELLKRVKNLKEFEKKPSLLVQMKDFVNKFGLHAKKESPVPSLNTNGPPADAAKPAATAEKGPMDVAEKGPVDATEEPADATEKEPADAAEKGPADATVKGPGT